MPFLALVPHPSTPCEHIHALVVEVRQLRSGALQLIYRLEGDIGRLNVPARQPPARADELWRHTCFEAFVRTAHGTGYAEFNFAPSGQWAAYRFTDYRSGMTTLDLATAPSIGCRRDPRHLEIDVRLELPSSTTAQSTTAQSRAALAAVLEDDQGRIFYWALAHPPGRPDFHGATGFALTLGDGPSGDH